MKQSNHMKTIQADLPFPLTEDKKELLEAYVALLLKWNKKINLIGRTTEQEIWQRHILDSIQLLKHIPQGTRILTDFGSGAGIPAIILAILAPKEHISEVRALESVGKKARFMEEAARITGANMTVYNQRIEDIQPWESDVISARAFAPLDKLLEYAAPFIFKNDKKESLCLLLKGCNVKAEIEKASNHWKFDHQLIPSMVQQDDAGYILQLKGVRKGE